MAHARKPARERVKLASSQEKKFEFLIADNGITDPAEIDRFRQEFEVLGQKNEVGPSSPTLTRAVNKLRAGEFRSRAEAPSKVDPRVITARRNADSRQRRLSQGRIKTEALQSLLSSEGASGSLLGV